MNRSKLVEYVLVAVALVGLTGVLATAADPTPCTYCVHATGGGSGSLGSCATGGDAGKTETETAYDGSCDSQTNSTCTPSTGTKQITPRKYKCTQHIDEYGKAYYTWDEDGTGSTVTKNDCS